jgi:hypothetical protein
MDDFFYSHERADIQLYAAICLADIIRIYAPNLPDVPPEKMLVSKRKKIYLIEILCFSYLIEYVSFSCTSITWIKKA